MRFTTVVKAACVGSLGCLVFCSSGSTTVDGGSDVQTVDVKPDKQVNGQDSGDAAGCGSGLQCEVCDNGYVPSQMAAPYAYPNLCAPADIAAYVVACGSNTGNQTDCNNWQNSEQTSAPNCLGCAYSNLTDAKWGAFACDTNGNCILNTGGCVDIVTGLVSQEKQAGGSGSCGDLIDTDNGCQNYACDGCTAQSDYDSCLTSAEANECNVYDGPVENGTGVCSVLANNSAFCFANSDADLTTMLTLMCGATSDAGGVSDAGDAD